MKRETVGAHAEPRPLPEGWRMASLAEATTESVERNNARLNSALLFGVSKSAGLIPMKDRVKGASTDRCKVVRQNAFAYNPMRINIGSIARNETADTLMVSPDYVVFEAQPDCLLPEYLDHFRRSHTWQTFVAAAGDGSVRVRIYYDHLSQLRLPLPPRAEQRKIAAILTAVDDKLDVIARQIEATQTLKQGLMQTLFSRGVGTQDADGRWVPHTEFKETDQGRAPAVWSVQTLEQVAVVERGKFSARPRNDPKYFEGGDIPFVQTGDVAKSGRLISTASQFLNEAGLGVSKLFEPGTIFLTIAANIGDAAIAAIPMACPDSVVGIRAVEGACDPAWLYYLLSANKGYFDSRATQNAQKNINLQVLRPFRFAMPPPAEQAQIGSVLTALDEKLESLAKRLQQHQNLKRGLMQKLLTGEWRVKVDAELAA